MDGTDKIALSQRSADGNYRPGAFFALRLVRRIAHLDTIANVDGPSGQWPVSPTLTDQSRNGQGSIPGCNVFDSLRNVADSHVAASLRTQKRYTRLPTLRFDCLGHYVDSRNVSRFEGAS